jgi:hypothetical protein
MRWLLSSDGQFFKDALIVVANPVHSFLQRSAPRGLGDSPLLADPATGFGVGNGLDRVGRFHEMSWQRFRPEELSEPRSVRPNDPEVQTDAQ